MRSCVTFRFIAFFALLASTLPAGAQLYSVQELKSSAGYDVYGSALNGYGQVTGLLPTSTGGEDPFLWNGTKLLDLGNLGGTQGYGTAINASGEVTGDSSLAGDMKSHAFLWNGTKMVDLGTLGGSNSGGTAINAAGEVTGWSDMPGDAAQHAFLWNGTKLMDLGTLGGTNSAGVAINDSGQVTGTSDIAGNAYSHGFLWNGTTMKDLGTLPGTTTVTPAAMNNAGQIVGGANNASYSVETGFIWNGTKMMALPGGTARSSASAINAKGEVTGSGELKTDKKFQPYLWNGAKAVRMAANTSFNQSFLCGSGRSISSSTGRLVGNTCEFAGLSYPFFWDGFEMLDLDDLVASSSPDLDIGESVLINNQDQILDGSYLLSPIPGGIGLDIPQPYSFAGCQNVAGYVSTSMPAPAGGLVVSLSDNLAAASVPATVTIPAGAVGAQFTISTMPVTSLQSGMITATRAGHTASANLTLRPMGVLAVTLTPSTVIGGKPVAGKVTLECGAAPASITVTLSSFNAAVANPTVASLTIPKGQSSASFQVTTKKVASRVLVTIQASANNVSKSANLKLNK
jgi:probable HAF family extracellular repeat protein